MLVLTPINHIANAQIPINFITAAAATAGPSIIPSAAEWGWGVVKVAVNVFSEAFLRITALLLFVAGMFWKR